MSLKSKIQTLITAANAKTGKTDATLTDAVQTLVDGYGQGADPVINPLSVTANGTYTAPSGVDGYSPVTVNVPQGITPSGNINITDTNVTDVTNYATAQVVDADLIASNIKKDVNILGVVGTFEGGGGTTITDGIVVKARDANGYATEADYYLAANGSIPARTFGTGTAGSMYLTTNATTLTIHEKPNAIGDYAFAQLKKLTTLNIDLSEVTSVGRNAFDTLSLLNKEISLPKCTSAGILAFSNSPHLSKIILPKIVSFPTATGSNIMKNCTRLTEVQLGSVDYTFTNLSTDAFSGCTQAGLTITVYSNGANADNVLTRIRNGATNATIIIKASENTTYGGVSYNAGETMITSNP